MAGYTLTKIARSKDLRVTFESTDEFYGVLRHNRATDFWQTTIVDAATDEPISVSHKSFDKDIAAQHAAWDLDAGPAPKKTIKNALAPIAQTSVVTAADTVDYTVVKHAPSIYRVRVPSNENVFLQIAKVAKYEWTAELRKVQTGELIAYASTADSKGRAIEYNLAALVAA